MTILLLALGILVLAAAVLLWRSARRALRTVVRVVLRCAAGLVGLVALALIAGGGYLYWYCHRPLPQSVGKTLFRGVDYVRDVRRTPRALVIHVVKVDLTAPGVRVLVTPGQPITEQQLRARTTSQFLQEFGLRVAVNGDAFRPWHSWGLFDYYPHVGDPVDALGFAASEGTVYSEGPATATLFVSRDNRATFGSPAGEVHNALSGIGMVVHGGKVTGRSSSQLEPRTAVGVDASGNTLIIVVVDGRQPHYSEGVSLQELGAILLEYGAWQAMNLDGGGSTTLVMEGPSGEPLKLSCPIHTRVPGRERPIANHLGILAQKN